MVVMRIFQSGVGSSGQDRSGQTEDKVREMIHTEVVSIVRGQIPELFGSIKTAMMEFFDDRYAAYSETTAVTATTTIVAARIGAGRAFQYQNSDNTKPSMFNGVYDPIIVMRWLLDVEGCLFTCSCPAD